MFVEEDSPQHLTSTSTYRIAELYQCCSYKALTDACTDVLRTISATKAVEKTILALIVQFCGRRRDGEVLWISLTTLPWCNLRNAADVHNTCLALVAMETLSGKLERKGEVWWWSRAADWTEEIAEGESKRVETSVDRRKETVNHSQLLTWTTITFAWIRKVILDKVKTF